MGKESKKGVVLATTVVFMMMIVAMSVLVIVLTSTATSSAIKAKKLASEAITINDIGNKFATEVASGEVLNDIQSTMNTYLTGTGYSCIVTETYGGYSIRISKNLILLSTVEVRSSTPYAVVKWEYSGEKPSETADEKTTLRNLFICCVYGDKDTANSEDVENSEDDALKYLCDSFSIVTLQNEYTVSKLDKDIYSLSKNGSTYYFKITKNSGKYSFSLMIKSELVSDKLSGNTILDVTVFESNDKIYVRTSDGSVTEITYSDGNLYFDGEFIGDTYTASETTTSEETGS